MALENELALMGKMRDELLRNHEGKFVLIHRSDLHGACDSIGTAMLAIAATMGWWRKGCLQIKRRQHAKN